MSRIRFQNITTPPLPPSGRTWLFIDSADNHLKTIDDAGTVVDLTEIKSGSLTLSREYRTITANDTYGANDSLIYIDATSNDITLTLPLASSAVSGGDTKIYDAIRIDSTSGSVVKIDTTGTDTINGVDEFQLYLGESVSLSSDGTNWWIKE